MTGFGLEPPAGPALFTDAGLQAACDHVIGDVRDPPALEAAVQRAAPDVVFHLAAQPLVRASYQRPVETIETNVLGTAKLLEALRVAGRRCGVVVVTTDKVYEDRDWDFGYREGDRLGGYDPFTRPARRPASWSSRATGSRSSTRRGWHSMGLLSLRHGPAT